MALAELVELLLVFVLRRQPGLNIILRLYRDVQCADRGLPLLSERLLFFNQRLRFAFVTL